MIYYVLRWDDDCTEGAHPRAESGKEVRFWRYPRPWDVEHASARVPLDDLESDPSTEEDLTDYIFIGGGDLLVSQKVKRLLDQVRVGHELGFLPTTIVNRRGWELARYVMIYPRNEPEGLLDEEVAEVEYYPDTKVVFKVKKWAVHADRVPDSDLFHCHHAWLAGDVVKSLFESNDVTGFQFLPAWGQ